MKTIISAVEGVLAAAAAILARVGLHLITLLPL
jgi:hypothetical protein